MNQLSVVLAKFVVSDGTYRVLVKFIWIYFRQFQVLLSLIHLWVLFDFWLLISMGNFNTMKILLPDILYYFSNLLNVQLCMLIFHLITKFSPRISYRFMVSKFKSWISSFIAFRFFFVASIINGSVFEGNDM